MIAQTKVLVNPYFGSSANKQIFMEKNQKFCSKIHKFSLIYTLDCDTIKMYERCPASQT